MAKNYINGIKHGVEIHAKILNEYSVLIDDILFILVNKEWCEDNENEICYFKGTDGSIFECLVAEGTFKN